MLSKPEDRVFVNSLKAGDEVFVETMGGCLYKVEPLDLKTVLRVTKQYVIVPAFNGCETKFRKDNLEEAGRKLGRRCIGDPHNELAEYNPANIKRYERQQKIAKCMRVIKWLGEKKFKDISDELLDEYYSILVQFEKKGDEKP